jgi:1-deoxy-D-xylulose-5-phosphate reductoisomerase
MPRNIVVLGSTGSIGRQTLDVVTQFPEIHVYGLAARRSSTVLEDQIRRFAPDAVALSEQTEDLPAFDGVEVIGGRDIMSELSTRPDVDLVVVATSGRAGLLPTVSALRAGKLVALANKETLVMAGSVIRQLLESGEGGLVPIDSEHSAIWQCLRGEPADAIERLTLTASGGALRDLTHSELEAVTPEQALRHPTWSMGRKITVDSANLMNKGLEAIEARWLFDVPFGRVEVVMHAQSIVHSLVTYRDGSTKAQLGLPDMRLPIQYALSHPERWSNSLPRLDLAEVGTLTFGPVDLARYPALRIALEAGTAGGTYPAVLCAADEVGVESFLNGTIRFTDIPRIVEDSLQAHTSCSRPGLDDILEADRWARFESGRLVSARRL